MSITHHHHSIPLVSMINIQGHTIIIAPKQIAPEHLLHRRDSQTQLPTFQCMTPSGNPHQCMCPPHAICPVLIATRAAVLFELLPLAQQIIIPWRDSTLTRRLPPAQFAAHLNNEADPHTRPTQEPWTPPDSMSETHREIRSLEHMAQQEQRTGRQVAASIHQGVRLGAQDTLRRLRAIGPSQQPTETIPRLWCIWIPRNFHAHPTPYQVFRANYDGLNWSVQQGALLHVKPTPQWIVSGY